MNRFCLCCGIKEFGSAMLEVEGAIEELNERQDLSLKHLENATRDIEAGSYYISVVNPELFLP